MFKTVYARYRNKNAYDDSYTLAEVSRAPTRTVFRALRAAKHPWKDC